MRYLLPFLLTCLLSTLQPLCAQNSTDPGDLFVNAYMAAQQAEKSEQAGNFKTALSKYRYAQEVLETIATKFPSWQPPIVNYRKQRTVESIARVQEKVAKFGPGKGAVNDTGGGLEGGPLPTSEDPLSFAPPAEPDPAPESLPPTRSTSRKNAAARAAETDSTADLEGAINRMKKLQTDLREANSATDRAEREKKELVRKFEEAIQAREAAEKQQKVLQTRADSAEEKLLKEQSQTKVDAEKIKALQTEANEAKRLLKTARIDQEAEIEVRKQLNDRLQAAQAKIAKITGERDALDKASKEAPQRIQQLQMQLDKANTEKKDLTDKLADTKAQLVTMTSQRDDAMKQLLQLKEAAKNVDKLVADNAALMARLTATEKSVANFKAEG